MTVSSIEVRDVSKRYGDFVAVDSISFAVGAGTIFGLLGPNGAGKTTTIRMIMNITVPDSGSITVLGKPSTDKASRQIGYLPEERGLYKRMKVLDHLKFLGEIRGLSGADAVARATKWLERLDLATWGNKRVEELSKGMQQKIQFIGSVLHDPEVIILDEPFSGLDPINSRLLKEEVLRFREEGRTVVLSTHVMEQAEKLCDEIALINRSHVVLNGSLPDIRRSFSGNRLMVSVRGSGAELRDVPGVKRVRGEEGAMEVELDEAMSAPEFLRAATARMDVESAVPHQLSLDEIFVTVVSGAPGAEVTQ